MRLSPRQNYEKIGRKIGRIMTRAANSCIWRHVWGKWTDKKCGQKTQEGRVLGEVIIQERRCERCNLVELRTAEASINLWA